MKTENQLKAEIYNIINPIISLFWLSNPKASDDYPLAIYQIIDTINEYSFGIERSAESRIFQIDIYTDPGKMASGDSIFESVKTAMEGIGYRLMAGPEFLDETINKIIRATRWERYNV